MERGKVWLEKDKPGDSVWWVERENDVGTIAFTFDKKKIYYLFRDYPEKLSVKEWMIFNKENPYWENFFRERNDVYEAKHFKEISEMMKKHE